MQRRTFINITAGAATALAFDPLALTKGQEPKTPVVYPDPAVEIVDPRFGKYKVINAAIERLYTGTRWAEGPVWFGDGRYLLFSDIPNNRILRWLEDTGEVFVVRTCETSLALGPSYTFESSSPLSFRFQRPKL
jgi:gluconolactonase